MNLSSDVFFGILLKVNDPINKVLESNRKIVVAECHGEAEGVALLVEVVWVGGLHRIYMV